MTFHNSSRTIIFIQSWLSSGQGPSAKSYSRQINHKFHMPQTWQHGCDTFRVSPRLSTVVKNYGHDCESRTEGVVGVHRAQAWIEALSPF